MTLYLILLSISVFLGTELLAVSSPFAQVTPYRLLILGLVPIFIYKFLTKDKSLTIQSRSISSWTIAMYLFWWLRAALSVLWVQDLTGWLQAMFLLTLGILAILAFYFFIQTKRDFEIISQVMWWMMTFLVLWGLAEVVTGQYVFADLAKLDKYNTFDSAPWTRKAVTHFENQNDYATMLIAYLPLSLIVFQQTKHWFMKFATIGGIFVAALLIVMTGSDMIFLCLFLYFIIFFALNFKWDFSLRQVLSLLSIALLAVILLFTFSTKAQAFVDDLVYTHSRDLLTGNTGRLNLMRNGWTFLGQTYGLGVGAGNIEYWMEHFRQLPTKNIINMHNWWFEILVAYGPLTFLMYVGTYALQIFKLFKLRSHQDQRLRLQTNALIAFLLTYVLASVTSSSLMLIEWHWSFMGLVLAYIKLNEQTLSKESKE